MITPEMMEKLGGKRGTPRGPDMTNREISKGEAAMDDTFAGAESLDDAIGEWQDGRGKTRRKRAGGRRSKPRRDKAYDDFVAANDRLDSMVAQLRSYIGGLRQFCDCHSTLSSSLVDGLSGFESVQDDVNAYHAASQRWCRTSKVPHVDSSLHSKVEVALEFTVIDPIVAHIEVRRSLQAQLAIATGNDRRELLEEVALFSQSMAAVMKGPMRALRRAHVDLFDTAAAVARGENCESENDSQLEQAAVAQGDASESESGPQPNTAPAVDHPETVTTLAQDSAQASATAGIWQEGSLKVAWPDMPSTASALSHDTCLTVCGYFGWENGHRMLQISLHNECSVAVSDIALEVLHSESTDIVVATVPLLLARLQPHEKASTCVRLGFAEDAELGLVPPQSPDPAAKEDEDFDSFCTERLEYSSAFTPQSDARSLGVKRQDSAGSETQRSAANWALDADAFLTQRVHFALRCRELPEPRKLEAQIPYHLLLDGHHTMAYDEFEQQWNCSPNNTYAGTRTHVGNNVNTADDTHVVAGSGYPETASYAKSLARRRAYSGTTRVCVRVEGHGPLIGWARFDDDTPLSDVRTSLMCNPAFQAKLPADWVFVKKNAPVGKKAEGKWTVRNLGHEIVLRGKSPHASLPASVHNEPVSSAQWGALTEDNSGTIDPAPFPSQDVAPISRRTFAMSTRLGVSDLVKALARGGITLVARVEQHRHGVAGSEGLLRFGGRAGVVDSEDEQVVFLLQMERQIHLQEPEPEPEPDASTQFVASQRQELPQSEWSCSLQASRAELEPAFESCIRSLALCTPDLLERVELVGCGQPYSDGWGGVTLSDAQAGVGNDDGYLYDDFGGISHEQTVLDFLEAEGKVNAKNVLKAVISAFVSAGVAEGNWLHDLICMRNNGKLEAFLVASTAQGQPAAQKDAAQPHSNPGQQNPHDCGDYGGVSLEDTSGDADCATYDYGEYGGVTLEEAAAFTSSDDDEQEGTIRPHSVADTASPSAEQLSSMDREAAAMVARMEATSTEISAQITDDMKTFIAHNPNATLSDWTLRSEWAKDTEYTSDGEDSALSAHGGAWQLLWAAATHQAAVVRPINGQDIAVHEVAASTSVAGESPPSNTDSSASRSTVASKHSSSAAWLAQRHMHALTRGTSFGSTARIAVSCQVARLPSCLASPFWRLFTRGPRCNGAACTTLRCI